jgi:hypothetical protein
MGIHKICHFSEYCEIRVRRELGDGSQCIQQCSLRSVKECCNFSGVAGGAKSEFF